MTTSTMKRVIRVFKFKSQSNPDQPPYETLLYSDGSCSCNCKGWTMAKPGKPRTCRHLIAAGLVPVEQHEPEGRLASPSMRTMATPGRAAPTKTTTNNQRQGRRFNLDL